MISADEDVPQRLDFRDYLIGIATVADRIAEIDDQIVGGCSRETGVQRFKIAVNVAEKKDTHKARIIASSRANSEEASWR